MEGRAAASNGAFEGGHLGNAASFTVYSVSPLTLPVSLLLSSVYAFLLSGAYPSECWSKDEEISKLMLFEYLL